MSFGRLTNKIKLLYREHYSFVLFCFLSGLLAAGLSSIHSLSYLPATIAVILIIASFAYYYGYFKKFRFLVDAYSHREYYFEAYSVWGILTFNALFILSFAYIGAILAILFPNLGFGSADFYDLLLYLLQTILDGITFGFLSSYDISLSEIELHGFFADSYAYITNLIIDLALLTTVSSVIWESIETKQKLKKIIQSGHIDPNYFAILTPLKVKEVIRNISSGKLNIRTQGGYLVQMLLQSNSKEARDIMLQVMQSACNSDVFLTCLDYFHKNHDHRFWKVCKRINNKEKRAILRSKGII